MAAPKLRFKEFSEDYNFSKFQEASIQIIDGDRGNNYPKSDDFYDNEYCLFLNAGNVTKSGFKFENTQFINKEKDALLRKGKLQKNDLVITTRGTVGNIAYFDESIPFENIRINSGMVIARSEIDVEPIYLNQILKSDLFEKWLEKNVFGSAQPQLTVKLLNSISISYPSKAEQTKIATFLSAVDEKISQLTQKHALLSQYKQGMMQKLFSQQIRFKADDGCEFGDWRKVKFSESFVFHNTNSYSRALLSEVGEVMNIHYGDIHTKFSMLFDVSKEIVPFLNDQIDFTKIAENQFLKEGDLVIADASEDYKDIGKAIEVVHLNNQKVVAGLHTYIARPVQPFALGFCGYLMQTFEVREQIKKLATGTSVLGISKTNIGKVEIKLPCLEEQTKIANFLSSIDQKIDVVSEQLEQAKLWKKGLLQQMFV